MQQVWRKRWRNTAWFALGAVTLLLLVSAVNKKNHKACKGIEVTFSSEGNNFFIEEKGVADVLKANGLAIGQPVEAINLQALEKILKNDQWIADAQLFFDNRQVLQVAVEEKIPVARIFTGGGSFYIDSTCTKLPLSEKLSARIPMFTNFPSDKSELSKPDSLLMASVKDLAMFIQADEFWKAQVSQVDITPDGFVMIPTVGNHLIELGKDGDWQHKFDRLFSFYKQVWIKVGFEKYEKIDVRFNGQVVATVKGAKFAIADSAKVKMASADLFADVQKVIEDGNPPGFKLAAGKDKEAGANEGFMKNTPVPIADAEIKILRQTNTIKAVDEKETTTKQPGTSPASKPQKEKKEHVKQQMRPAIAKQEETSNQSEDNKVPKAVMRKPLLPL